MPTLRERPAPRMRPSASRLTALLLGAVLAASCSSRPTPTPSSATTVPSAAPVSQAPAPSSPVATGSPSATPASAAPGTPSATPAGRSAIRAAIDALHRTSSYRLSLETRQGRTVDRSEILRVAGPPAGWSARRESTSETVRAIVIGDRAWVDRGSGAFARAGIAEAAALVGLDTIDGILDAYDDPDLASALRFVGREDHGGTSADHHRATIDATGEVDVWIAPDGHLVAISSSGWPGTDDALLVEISDVDDPANVVRPPG